MHEAATLRDQQRRQDAMMSLLAIRKNILHARLHRTSTRTAAKLSTIFTANGLVLGCPATIIPGSATRNLPLLLGHNTLLHCNRMITTIRGYGSPFPQLEVTGRTNTARGDQAEMYRIKSAVLLQFILYRSIKHNGLRCLF